MAVLSIAVIPPSPFQLPNIIEISLSERVDASMALLLLRTTLRNVGTIAVASHIDSHKGHNFKTTGGVSLRQSQVAAHVAERVSPLLGLIRNRHLTTFYRCWPTKRHRSCGPQRTSYSPDASDRRDFFEALKGSRGDLKGSHKGSAACRVFDMRTKMVCSRERIHNDKKGGSCGKGIYPNI
jgi:hypothetical protein